MSALHTDATILIVDDEKKGRHLIKSILKQANYSTLEASDGLEALSVMRSEHTDLVVLDIRMPRMDGYKVCQEMRSDESLKWIPVIMLTVMGDTLDRVRGHRLGIDDYMVKPVNPEEFLTRVSSVLKRRRMYEEISMKDSLTGLYNLNFYQKQLDIFAKMAKRTGAEFSIAVADIDGFKAINDTYGHTAGNDVLIEISRVMKNTLRESDIITRYGGDEFTVIFPDLAAPQAAIAVSKLKNAVSSEIFIDKRTRKRIPVTLSIGTATWTRDITDPNKLFDIADRNMYEEKKRASS